MSFDALIIAIKGGAGSGNFGHSGIPGHVGGSAPQGGRKLGNVLLRKDVATGEEYLIKIVSNKDSRGWVEAARYNPKTGEFDISIGTTNPAKHKIPKETEIEKHLNATKPVETKPVETKPVETKPVETVKLLDKWEDVPTQSDVNRKAFFIRNDGKIVPVTVGSGEHAETIAKYPELMGLDKKEVDAAVSRGGTVDNLDLWDMATSAGNIRATASKKESSIDNLPLTTANLKKVQRLVDDGKLPAGSGHRYYWTDTMNEEYSGISFTYDDLMSSKYLVNKNGNYTLKSIDAVVAELVRLCKCK